MKINSLFQKAGIVFYKKTIMKKYMVNENMYYLGEKNLQFQKILMYFPNPEFMHLGDHFYFEPLAHILKNHFNFKIMPTKHMEFYFRELKYCLADDSDIEKADLIITRIEFLNDRKLKNKNVLFIDTAYPKIKKTICEDIVQKVIKFVKLSSCKVEYNNLKPSKIKNINILKKFGLNKNDKYLLFNNYIDSGNYIVGRNMYKRIEDFTRNFAKKNNLKVIHIGTNKEKSRDKKNYDFVDIDLRGKTIPRDIFDLAAAGNIKCNISFDAFQMHVFFINNKKNYILFRGRLSKNARDFIIKRVNPPFPCNKPINKLIEYIN